MALAVTASPLAANAPNCSGQDGSGSAFDLKLFCDLCTDPRLGGPNAEGQCTTLGNPDCCGPGTGIPNCHSCTPGNLPNNYINCSAALYCPTYTPTPAPTPPAYKCVDEKCVAQAGGVSSATCASTCGKETLYICKKFGSFSYACEPGVGGSSKADCERDCITV